MVTPVMTNVSAAELRELEEAAVRRHGGDAVLAERVADSLMWADLRGLTFHGVGGKLKEYLRLLDRPESHGTALAPRSGGVGDVPTVDSIDGSGRLAQDVGAAAVTEAVQAASERGVGLRCVHDTNTAAALGWFVDLAIRRGMIGIAVTDGPRMMGLPGVRGRVIGNQGHAFGFPRSGVGPIIFDSALSTISLGDVLASVEDGRLLPEGVCTGPDGALVRDPAVALSDGVYTPAGGHKGFGLAVVFELLTSVLGGARTLGPRMEWNGVDDISMTLMVIDPAAVSGGAGFEQRAEALSTMLHDLGAVRLPGDRAHRMMQERMATGIPVAGAVLEALRSDVW